MATAFPTAVPPPPTAETGSQHRYDVIVIGSGVGGSSAAGILAARGRRVLVIEKNAALGGILASYVRDGFKIDRGSHLVSRGAKGPLGLVLRTAGLTGPRFLTHRIPVRSAGIFQIAAPEHRSQLPRCALQAARLLGLGTSDTFDLGALLLHVFTLTEMEIRRWDGRTLDELIREHTEHPAAYFLFSFLASIFYVLPPWQVSAGEAIRGLRSVLSAYNLSYVEGGMDSYIHTLLQRVPMAGGEVVVGKAVTAIQPGSNVHRVFTDDGRDYEAPVVICNLAPRPFLSLLDPQAVPADYAARLKAIRGSGNAFQVKLALRRPLVHEGSIIGGVSLEGLTLADLSHDLMQRTVSAIEGGRLPDPLAVYAPVPTNYDPSLAPPGAQLIVASIYGPVRPDPRESAETRTDRIVRALEQLIPGLREELLFMEHADIASVGDWMGRPDNAAISNGQFPDQVGRRRLPVVTPFPGLYLCGDSAGGRGIGMELAATSALEVIGAVSRMRRSGQSGRPPHAPQRMGATA